MVKKHYHFIGVGGISMSALARLLYEEGHYITGSDINHEVSLDFCDTYFVNSFDRIKNADFVVVNSAIPENDAELLIAKSIYKKILTRGELLCKISKDYKATIAVSGTHGKTSTTEMIAECFLQSNLEPTVHIGGISNKFKSNLLMGKKNFFITEACEYKDAFLSLYPSIAVITNVEPEHLDYFQNFEKEISSFKKFAGQSGLVVAPKSLNLPYAITFGEGGDFSATSVTKNKSGKYFFDVWKKNNFFGSFQINSIMEKNIENALACIAVCDYVGITKENIFHALKNYNGVARRMEVLSTDPLVIHDYAHHPTEIKSTIDSVKKFYNKKVLVAFQPHTFSRTQSFFDDFTNVLSSADELFLLKTYSARENLIAGATAKDLCSAVQKNNIPASYYDSPEGAKIAIKKKLTNENVLLILGAGDIEKMWD